MPPSVRWMSVIQRASILSVNYIINTTAITRGNEHSDSFTHGLLSPFQIMCSVSEHFCINRAPVLAKQLTVEKDFIN